MCQFVRQIYKAVRPKQLERVIVRRTGLISNTGKCTRWAMLLEKGIHTANYGPINTFKTESRSYDWLKVLSGVMQKSCNFLFRFGYSFVGDETLKMWGIWGKHVIAKSVGMQNILREYSKAVLWMNPCILPCN